VTYEDDDGDDDDARCDVAFKSMYVDFIVQCQVQRVTNRGPSDASSE